jgi:methyltransferase
VWLTAAILTLVTAERLGELRLAALNTRRLLAAGASEAGARHYGLIVGLHALWLGGLWLLAWGEPVRWPFLAAFLLLQVLRAWVLATLGARWTTRILVVPGEELVRHGPYRWVRHPNYLVVIGEIAILPLVFGLVWYALLFSILNAGVLWVRIRAEERALAAGGAGVSRAQG